jgi:TonB family protein
VTSTLAANPAVRAVGLALIWFVLQGAVAGAVVGALLTALRRASATLRYFVACAGLVAMAVMPVATTARHWTPTPVTALVEPTPGTSAEPAIQPDSEYVSHGAATRGWRPRLAIDRAAPFVVLGWSTGVLLLTVQLLGGWVHIVRIRRRAQPPQVLEWVTTVTHLAGRLGIRRSVQLLESTLVGLPVMVGWLRPVILVPVSVFAGLTPDQIEAILAHELAHVRRGDYIVNALQRVVEIVLFYHPAVWWVSACVRREREHCCDDLAAPLSSSRLTYARALLALEEHRGHVPALAMGATGTGLFARIRRIVDPAATSHPALSKGSAMPIVLSLVALALTAEISVSHAAPEPSPNPRAATPAPLSSARVDPPPAAAIETVRPPVGGAAVPTGALAPQARGSIRGTVTDRQGGRAPGVTITVEPISAVGPRRTAVSEASGQFAVTDLPDGSYLLTAALSGFRKDMRRVEIVSGAAVTELVQLQVGSLSEVLTIVAPPKDENLTRSTNPDTPSPPPTPRTPTAVPDLLDAAKQAAAAGRPADEESAVREALALLQAAHPQPPAPGGPVRIGGDIRAPKQIHYVTPVYPRAARDAGIHGTVVIEATLDRNGTVADAYVVSGVVDLNDAALAAVRQWTYTPTLLGGVPVDVLMTVTVVFSTR